MTEKITFRTKSARLAFAKMFPLLMLFAFGFVAGGLTAEQLLPSILHRFNEIRKETGADIISFQEGQGPKGYSHPPFSLPPPSNFTGTWTTWYPNGQKKSEGNYVNGRQEDTWKAWDANGSLLYEFNYKAGRCHGAEIQYHQDGTKWKEQFHRDGVEHGKCTFWTKNKNALIGFYVDGKKHHGMFFGDGDGKFNVTEIEHYEDGKLVRTEKVK